MSDIPTKICKTCDRELVLGFFNIVKRNKDGHHSHCKTCSAAKAKLTPSYKKYSRPGGGTGKKWQRMNLNNEPN